MLNHPNMLKTHVLFINDDSLPPSILLEYRPFSIKKAINDKTLSKVQKSFIIYQIAEGMKYIHSMKINKIKKIFTKFLVIIFQNHKIQKYFIVDMIFFINKN